MLRNLGSSLGLCLIALLAHSIFAQEGEQGGEAGNQSKQQSTTSLFTQSFGSIVVSELGDKTFFIAAIMAMRYNRMAVLAGALLALFLMTGISTAFGSMVPVFLPPLLTHIAITVLFFFFGCKLLWDAYHEEEGKEESSEKDEVEQELNELHNKLMTSKASKHQEPSIEYNESSDLMNNKDPENKTSHKDLESKKQPEDCTKQMERVAAKLVFWQALTLTFLGEWGDRSQITTIALAAEGKAYVVFVGSFLGHVLCTSLAVVGGKFLAKKISEKTVNICGGVLFLIFGIHNLFSHP